MMTSVETIPIPYYNFDTSSLQYDINEIGLDVNNREYKRAVEQASMVLNATYESVIMTILDYRSYALMMLCKFDEATKDAYDIITYKPTLPAGYLRLGELYQIQGKQHKAIEAYEMGLQSVEVDHPHYPQMVEGKELAIKKSKTRVDFISRLPLEIVDSIMDLIAFDLLPSCLAVSMNWRNKICQCPNTWKSLKADSGNSTDWTTAVMPRVSANVESLTMSTPSLRVFRHYLRTMKAGSFEKLRTLRLDTSSSISTNPAIAKELSGAFWKMSHSLTKLMVEFKQGGIVITPGDLLSFCPNLKLLEYSVPSYQLSDVLDNSVQLDHHKNLLDMHLAAKSITGQDLKRLLYCCQQLLRLRLNGSDSSVLNIIDTLCPNLKIFGYNAEASDVKQLESLSGELHANGLQQLYTCNGGTGVQPSAIFPLMHRNMHSLKILYINIEQHPQGQSESLENYHDLELQNLHQLTFWATDSGFTQPLILKSISNCTSLTRFAIASPKNLSLVIRELLLLPRLEDLRILYAHGDDADKDKLIQLLNRYSRISQPERHLKTVHLLYCKAIITGAVLNSLASIQTLEDIFFAGQTAIPTRALDTFFKKAGNRLTDIKLYEMDIVEESTLIVISKNSENLIRIGFKNLKNLSNQGIKDIVNRAPKLRSLTITKCKPITQSTVNYARTKLKDVIFIT